MEHLSHLSPEEKPSQSVFTFIIGLEPPTPQTRSNRPLDRWTHCTPLFKLLHAFQWRQDLTMSSVITEIVHTLLLFLETWPLSGNIGEKNEVSIKNHLPFTLRRMCSS